MVKVLRILSILVLLVGIFPFATNADAAKDDPWIFEGGGWGHGVGLSQFGAKGQAEAGSSASQILKFYYSNDAAISTPLSSGHWINQEDGLVVGLVSDTTVTTFKAVGSGIVVVCQPSATCAQVNEQVTSADTWFFETVPNPVDPDGTYCRVRRGSGDTGQNWGPGPCDATISQPQDTGTRVQVGSGEYAHGSIAFKASTNGFHALVHLTLEDYLLGLAEVPSSWHSEALKVQAIIGRSYGVSTALGRGGSDGNGRLSSCGCHLRSTSQDQVYTGWAKENPANGGNAWKSAVQATVGQVVTHPQSKSAYKVISTFYSSSNGGGSENVEDVWPGSPVPWLRSVTDPWSSNPSINPLARWTVLVSDADMESHLGWDEVHDAQKLSGPPGTLIKFTGMKDGNAVSVTLNGTQISTILKASGFGYEASGSTSPAVRVSPYIISAFDPPGFDDIAGNVFENAIEWLAQEEITLGCNPPTNDLYCPNDKLTRGEMAVFISRAMDLPEATQDYFTDDTGKFYEGAANRLKENGITAGCGGTKFCGELSLPREQMAVFFVRILKLPPTGTDYFVDDENSPYEDHINRIAEEGITLGCNPPTNNKFCPNDSVTRGQMAAFFKRVWGP